MNLLREKPANFRKKFERILKTNWKSKACENRNISRFSHDDSAPLLQSLKGRAGLSAGHIRSLVQEVFDNALGRMRAEGFPDDDIKNLRSASLHWLRHTSATADAKVRDHKDLQAGLRHQSLATTVDTYYNSRDEERHRSNKNLSIEDR